MAAQLWFDFSPTNGSIGHVQFCDGRSNASARSALNRWRSWPSGVLILVGPSGSGKSHLVGLWSKTVQGQIISASCIPQRLQGNIVVENTDHELDEEGLFHLLNRAASGQAKVLLVARCGPQGWDVQLGDLGSRLRAAEMVRIDEPDDDVLSCILQKLCKDRMIKLNDKLIQYLIPRMERSSQGALQLVDALNSRSLETSRPVNTALARLVLAELAKKPELLCLMEDEAASRVASV
ncbi:MAG: chromosomal replication initiator DnaA [Robiginitomaculum sp.]|nr:MAG: chromosomal replication initiator DnaA [Robiginitomaculum sp.]